MDLASSVCLPNSSAKNIHTWGVWDSETAAAVCGVCIDCPYLRVGESILRSESHNHLMAMSHQLDFNRVILIWSSFLDGSLSFFYR